MSYEIGAVGSSLKAELMSIKRDLIRERDLPPIRVNNCNFDLKLKQQWIALHEVIQLIIHCAPFYINY
jgi:hypothetical protein